MDGWAINKTIDLQRDAFEAIPQRCIELMVPGDSQAHTINITVLDGGVAADLSGCEASAYFILPNGENAILVDGYIYGNVVSIVFASACYAVPGVMRCIVRVESDTRIVSLIQYEFFVQRGITGEIIRPDEPRLQTKTATPSESSQRITYDTGYDGLRYVDVSAISSTYIGSGVTKKSAQTYRPGTQNQTISAGQYLNGAQTIEGDADLVASNIKNGVQIFGVTGNYGGASQPTQQKTVTPSFAGGATTYAVNPDSGYVLSKVIVNKDANLRADYIKRGVTIFGVTGTYEGGGGGGVNVSTAEKTLTAAASSIQFTGVLGEPTSFAVISEANLATGASPYKTADVVFDGTNVFGQYITNTNNAQMTYSASAFTKSYSGGTLTITGSGTNFQANKYLLVYTYGGSTSDVLTKTATVGSGATSISFTGLSAQPKYFSCMLKGGNIGTASGYTRAQIVVSDGENVSGLHMGSASQYSSSSWTASYSNGTLTIASASASNGGYFHQGSGFSYQLTYIV